MRSEQGFTLIELVITILIIGVLAITVVPKFVDMQSSALSASKKSMSGAVRAALSTAIAENHANPTVSALADFVQAPGVTAVSSGVQVTIGTSTYVVPTYTSTACTGATVATANTVYCVGDIP